MGKKLHKKKSALDIDYTWWETTENRQINKKSALIRNVKTVTVKKMWLNYAEWHRIKHSLKK